MACSAVNRNRKFLGGYLLKDLKHLIYFENLLQEANNELVKQAKAEGKRAIGYTCYFMPEVLLDLPGCFSVRLRAPGCTSPDIATYYLSGRVCHYARSLLERALEGGYNFLDAQMGTETCTATCRFQEHIQQKHLDSVEDMRIIDNDDFFCTFTDIPFKNTKNSYDHFETQLRAHVLEPLHEHFGIDISDETLVKAVEDHNEVCRLINEIGEYRKLDNPTITGYEFHVIQLVSLCCPKYLILPYLRETAEEMKTREPNLKKEFRCKVVLAGSENDDPSSRRARARSAASPSTISRPPTARASCRRTRCAPARRDWPTWRRSTTPTASSSPPTSSASTGATSA